MARTTKGRDELHMEVPDLAILDLEVTNEKLIKEFRTLQKQYEDLQRDKNFLLQKFEENQALLSKLPAMEAKLHAVQDLENILENAMLELNFLQTKCETLESEKEKFLEEATKLRKECNELNGKNETLAQQLKENKALLDSPAGVPGKVKQEPQVISAQRGAEIVEMAPPHARSTEKVPTPVKKKLYELIAAEEKAPPKVRHEGKSSATKCVLMVLTETTISRGLENILEKESMSVVAAESGEHALKLLDIQNFASIIMDINATSDGLTGVYLFKCIQKKSLMMSEKVIFVSSAPAHASFINFLKTTSNRFFEKPLENRDLIDYMRKM